MTQPQHSAETSGPLPQRESYAMHPLMAVKVQNTHSGSAFSMDSNSPISFPNISMQLLLMRGLSGFISSHCRGAASGSGNGAWQVDVVVGHREGGKGENEMNCLTKKIKEET